MWWPLRPADRDLKTGGEPYPGAYPKPTAHVHVHFHAHQLEEGGPIVRHSHQHDHLTSNDHAHSSLTGVPK